MRAQIHAHQNLKVWICIHVHVKIMHINVDDCVIQYIHRPSRNLQLLYTCEPSDISLVSIENESEKHIHFGIRKYIRAHGAIEHPIHEKKSVTQKRSKQLNLF
jgi:hypothetical protein